MEPMLQSNVVTSVSFTGRPSSPQAAGTAITLTASAEGSSNAVYKFWMQKDGVWTVIRNYSISNTCTYILISADSYYFSVYAKDVNSNTDPEAMKGITYTVSP